MNKLISKYQFETLAKFILSWCPNYMGYPSRKPYLPKLHISYNQSSEFVGEYDNNKKTIYVCYYQIRSMFDLIKTIIHEYTHYIQLYNTEEDRKYTRLIKKYYYWNHPFEVKARKNEEKYMRHIYYRIKKLDKYEFGKIKGSYT